MTDATIPAPRAHDTVVPGSAATDTTVAGTAATDTTVRAASGRDTAVATSAEAEAAVAANPVAGAAEPSTEELAASLRFSVTRLARLLRQQSDVGLTPTQLAALATVDRCGPIPVGALADEEQIGAPTATKIVDKLHAAGYLARTPSPADRRVTLVSTTPAGQALLSDIRARKTAWLTTRIAELDDPERDALASVVAVLDHLTAPTRTAATADPPEETTA